MVSIFLIPVGGQANRPIAKANNTGLFQYRILASQASGKYVIRVSGDPELTSQDSDVFEVRNSNDVSSSKEADANSSPNLVGLGVGLSILFLILVGGGLLYK